MCENAIVRVRMTFCTGGGGDGDGNGNMSDVLACCEQYWDSMWAG